MNRDDVIDVLSVVAAATRRTVGESDVKVWASVMGDLDREYAMKAVRDHLRERPGVWLEPGHIVERVRAKRRDELEREPLAVKAARLEGLATKAADDIAELAARKGLPSADERKYHRASKQEGPQALAVPCPYCKAAVGYVCENTAFKGNKPRKTPHPSRVELAERKVS